MTGTSALTERDRSIIARARELAGLDGIDAIAAATDAADPALAYGIAFGRAQSVLTELAAIAERLGGS